MLSIVLILAGSVAAVGDGDSCGTSSSTPPLNDEEDDEEDDGRSRWLERLRGLALEGRCCSGGLGLGVDTKAAVSTAAEETSAITAAAAATVAGTAAADAVDITSCVVCWC